MRIKRGTTKNRKHKKVLKTTKGYRLTYSKLYRRAKEASLHAGQYSYMHRRHRRGQMRSEWIKTISAKLAGNEMSYNQLIRAMKDKNIDIDRKNLAEMAAYRPDHFDSLVQQVSA